MDHLYEMTQTQLLIFEFILNGITGRNQLMSELPDLEKFIQPMIDSGLVIQ